MTARPPSPPPDSRWHSIRPFTPRLLLKVREITSVSVTFSLSTSLDAAYLNPDQQGAELDIDGGTSSDILTSAALSKNPGITDTLKAGLIVKLNGTPWQKVVIHTEEAEEEAVVVLYGLFPARHYEVEFSVLLGEEPCRSVFVTSPGAEPQEDIDEPEAEFHTPVSNGVLLQTVTPDATPPSSPRDSIPPPPSLLTLEERLVQVKQLLVTAVAERDALINQLKTARKDSQRAEAALRAEVDTLKRAAEKNAAADLRSRQKLLALQETVKRLTAGAEEAEQVAKEIEGQLPDLERKAKAVEEEHARVKEEAERSQVETEEALRADKKKTSELDAELGVVNNRLDKLNGKRDKLASDVLPDLEEQLAALEREIEAIEKRAPTPPTPIEFDHEAHYPHHYQMPQPPVPFGHVRPPASSVRPPPIQRPSHGFNGANPLPLSPDGPVSLIGAANGNFVPRIPASHPASSARVSTSTTPFPRPQHGSRSSGGASHSSQEIPTPPASLTRSGSVSEASTGRPGVGVMRARSSSTHLPQPLPTPPSQGL